MKNVVFSRRASIQANSGETRRIFNLEKRHSPFVTATVSKFALKVTIATKQKANIFWRNITPAENNITSWKNTCEVFLAREFFSRFTRHASKMKYRSVNVSHILPIRLKISFADPVKILFNIYVEDWWRTWR